MLSAVVHTEWHSKLADLLCVCKSNFGEYTNLVQSSTSIMRDSYYVTETNQFLDKASSSFIHIFLMLSLFVPSFHPCLLHRYEHETSTTMLQWVRQHKLIQFLTCKESKSRSALLADGRQPVTRTVKSLPDDFLMNQDSIILVIIEYFPILRKAQFASMKKKKC